MMRKRLLTPILLGSLVLGAVVFVSVLSAPGCGGNEGDAGTCSTTRDCDNGWACNDGRCRVICTSDNDCSSPVDKCRDGLCLPVNNPTCTRSEECRAPGQCQNLAGAACVGGSCLYTLKEAGTSCNDGDLCTTSDQCDASGACVGDATRCDNPPAAECINNDGTYRIFQSPGSCQSADGSCAYRVVDEPCANCAATCATACAALPCDPLNGGCRYHGYCDPLPAPPTCLYEIAPDGNPCDLVGLQDGKCLNGSCTDSCSTNADCEDGNPCTTDTCDTVGVCRSAQNAVACNDGNPCTSGDACSLGTCQGTPVAPATSCGTCMACNATGACVDTPADDAACGVIDCDGLDDVPCRDYADLTDNRCAGLGRCKAANLPQVCINYVNAEDGIACGSGNCAACAGGVCGAKPSACTGTCATCSGSGTTFNCAPSDALCTGNCDTCSGSGTTFNCAPSNAACTGNCATCSGTDTAFNCSANNAACTGNCATCSGSATGTTFNCAANPSACGDCKTCAASGTAFNCANAPECTWCSGGNKCDANGGCVNSPGTCAADCIGEGGGFCEAIITNDNCGTCFFSLPGDCGSTVCFATTSCWCN